MIVVADAGPLQYLVRIAAIDVLAPLYERVLVPLSVAGELQQNNTPVAVRAWIAQPPAWCEIATIRPSIPLLPFSTRANAPPSLSRSLSMPIAY